MVGGYILYIVVHQGGEGMVQRSKLHADIG